MLVRYLVHFEKKIKKYSDALSVFEPLKLQHPTFYLYCSGTHGKVDYFAKCDKTFPKLSGALHWNKTKVVGSYGIISGFDDYFGNIPGDWDIVQDAGPIDSDVFSSLMSKIPGALNFLKCVVLIESREFDFVGDFKTPVLNRNSNGVMPDPFHACNEFNFPGIMIYLDNMLVKKRFYATIDFNYSDSEAESWISRPPLPDILAGLPAECRLDDPKFVFVRTNDENMALTKKLESLSETFRSAIRESINPLLRREVPRSSMESSVPFIKDLKSFFRHRGVLARAIKNQIGNYQLQKKTERGNLLSFLLFHQPNTRDYSCLVHLKGMFFSDWLRLPVFVGENGSSTSVHVSEANKPEILAYLDRSIDVISNYVAKNHELQFPPSPEWFVDIDLGK